MCLYTHSVMCNRDLWVVGETETEPGQLFWPALVVELCCTSDQPRTAVLQLISPPALHITGLYIADAPHIWQPQCGMCKKQAPLHRISSCVLLTYRHWGASHISRKFSYLCVGRMLVVFTAMTYFINQALFFEKCRTANTIG